MKTVSLGTVLVSMQVLVQWILGFGSVENSSLCYPFISFSHQEALETPVAVNDTIIMAIGCGNYVLKGNVLENDVFNSDSAWLSSMQAPKSDKLSYDAMGNFIYCPDVDFRGEVTITYNLSKIGNADVYSRGLLIVYVEDDFDCDNVINRLDIDDDNDGILDYHEGDISVDSDGDGVPNCYDIDSDNDGIPDFTEWQTENSPVVLLLRDTNGDGWDDAFDSEYGGTYYQQTDTDLDGIPDFLDTDSDEDGITDFVEAFDVLNNQNPSMKFSNIDSDKDGLDESCDTIACGTSGLNPIGSSNPLPDHNNNGVRDWRDPLQVSLDGELPSALASGVKLAVYPNPVVNKCIVNFPKGHDSAEAPYSVSIYDMNGHMVYLDLFYNKRFELDLSNLKTGMYLIRARIGGSVYGSKIIKSN